MNLKFLPLLGILAVLVISGCVSNTIEPDDYYKDLYESTCYGKNNMILKTQAENIAKRYVEIQANLNTKEVITLSDIEILFDGASIIGGECNPDWFVTLQFNDTVAIESWRFFVQVSGRIENESMQGLNAEEFPDEYVLKKIEADNYYHSSYDCFPYIGGGASHRGPSN